MTSEIENKRTRPARSLSTIFATAFLLLSLIILLVSGGLQLFFNIQVQQNALTNQLQISAQNAANSVSGFIEENFSVLSTTAGITHPNTLPATEQTRILQTLLANQAAFRQSALYDTKDNQTANATRLQNPSSKRISSLITGDVLAQTSKGQRYISSLYFDAVFHEPLVLLAIPVTSSIGDFEGTLVAELNLISMWNLVNQLKVGNTGYAYVVDRDGRLIAFKDTARAFQGENVRNITLVDSYIKNPLSAPTRTSLYKGVDNTTVVGTYVSLKTPDWAVITEMPWQEAYRGSIQVGAVTAGIIIILGGLSVIVGIWLSRVLGNPLIELTSTVTAIASGELQRRAIVTGGLEIETLAGAFNNMTEQMQGLIGGLEERVSERTQVLEKRSTELQAASQIIRAVSSIQNTDALLERVTQLISHRLGYYHVGIFLLDDNQEYAILRSASGEAGKLLLANHHRVKIGERDIIDKVFMTGEPQIVSEAENDAIHFKNPLLPYTRSELALPLKITNRIIGIIDIHSEKTNAFDQNSISILQIVADQIGLGFERSQFLREMQQNAAALELALQENTSRTWRDFLERGRRTFGYKYDGVTAESITVSSARDPNAIIKDETVIINGNQDDNLHTLVVPIRLRGQTLGALNLQLNTADIPPETIRVVEEASNRLALALENSRLVQDAQRLAVRERQINVISAQAQQSADLNTLLQNTIKELGNAIGMPNTFIQVGLLPPDDRVNQ